MRHQLNLFLAALGFFTRLPLPPGTDWSPALLAGASRYLPWIGWIVGAAAVAVFIATAQVLPLSLAVLLSMLATIILTGALHEDGLADVCDGFGAGWEPGQILSIMKDSHIGTYGVLGLLLTLSAKAAALIELAKTAPLSAVVIALFIAHPLSRLAAVLLLHKLDYARPEGPSKARPFAQPLSKTGLATAFAGGLLPLLLLKPVEMMTVLILATTFTLWAAWQLQRRLGGYTGDCLGAVQQGTELLCYLGILALCNFI